jgi:hypothetical protein
MLALILQAIAAARRPRYRSIEDGSADAASPQERA